MIQTARSVRPSTCMPDIVSSHRANRHLRSPQGLPKHAAPPLTSGMPRDRQSTQLAQENSLDIDLVRSALEPDYTILEELGRGGMAVVYRAKERALDREVAIKVLPSFMVMDKAFVERFQHEARTAGKLEHPNIVPIYRVGKK